MAIGGDVVDLASKRGQLGGNALLPEGVDLNTVLTPGLYGVRGATATNCPSRGWGYLQVMNGYSSSNSHRAQIWLDVGNMKNPSMYIRQYYYSSNPWSEWIKIIMNTDIATSSTPGIVKPGTGTSIAGDGSLNVDTATTSANGIVQLSSATNSESELVAATSKAVKTAYDKAVEAHTQATEAVEIDSSGYSSNQHWVRYKDGRQIIYSDWMDSMNDTTVTFIKPFTTNPAMIGFDNANVPGNMERKMKFTAITETNFTTQDWAYGSPNKSGCWIAMGTWK